MTRFPALIPTRKQGTERLHARAGDPDVSLLDFWRWAFSDLVSNTLRGILAEFIVAAALGIHDQVRVQWDAVDLVSAGGTRIEVKSAAYLQSWSQQALSAINFTIAPRFGWDAAGSESAAERRRSSDVYVFCLLAEQDQNRIDPLDLDQWRFYVLGTRRLDEQAGANKTISLSRLLELQPRDVSYSELAETIAAVHRASGSPDDARAASI